MPPPARRSSSRRRCLSAYARRLVKDPTVPSSPSAAAAARPALRLPLRQPQPWTSSRARSGGGSSPRGRDGLAPSPSATARPPATAPLREALSEYLGRARGVGCDAERIVIVNGSQQALDLVSRVLLDPGDGAVVEEPHYSGATVPFEAAGARLIGFR
jgi:GntR family transcriptional regulator/MocR family aminotransferase